jgi:hypothetical protein
MASPPAPAERRSAPATTMDARRLTLTLAGVSIALDSRDPTWNTAIARRFGPFLTDAEPDFAIDLHTDEDVVVLAETGAPPAGLRRLDGDEAFTIALPGLAGGADLRVSRGWVRGAPGTDGIEVLLRHLMPGLIGDGLVLHAAALADGDGAWACCGPSGAGKSTLARLLPERALCEEMVAIRGVPHGFVLDSLPLHDARPASLPLRGICCLRHGPTHRRIRLDPGPAARRLARIGPWPSYSPTAMRRTFAAFTRLVEHCPAFDLAFTPREDVWETLVGGSDGGV